MMFRKLFFIAALAVLMSVSGVADNIVLDFEGLQNNEKVENFYNGGTGSEGSTKGYNYNVTFSGNTLAIIDIVGIFLS